MKTHGILSFAEEEWLKSQSFPATEIPFGDWETEQKEQESYIKNGEKQVLRSIASVSTVSSCSSSSSCKRLHELDGEESVSSECTKRSRKDSDGDETILNGLGSVFASANLKENASTGVIFDPRATLPTERNVEVALGALAEAEQDLRVLRIKKAKNPLDGSIRRQFDQAFEYVELLTSWFRQDFIETELAVEAFANPVVPKGQNCLTISAERDILPDIVPSVSSVAFVNGRILTKCLYGYIASYDRIATGKSTLKSEKVAVKVYHKSYVLSRQTLCGRSIQENPIRELKIQQALARSSLRSDILPVDYVLESSDKLFAVFPFVEQDMFAYVTSRDRMSEQEARILFLAMVKTLDYCHAMGVVHRDLSLENFLIRTVEDENGNLICCEPVLIDFGLCAVMEPDRSSQGGWLPIRYNGAVGKTGYMAPEVFDERNPSRKSYDGRSSDVWSLGVCLFAMLTRFPPWQRPEHSDNHFRHMVEHNGMRNWLDLNGVILSSQAVQLLDSIFKIDPRERITLSEILDHSWLSSLQAGSSRMSRK